MDNKMKAIRISQKSSTKELVPESVDRPVIKPGYVVIKVKAFGVNESEVTSRKGESSADFSFPRILGIEGVGVVAEVGENSSFEVGQKVATMMGGLGRSIDGAYAEYTQAKEENVIPISTDLDWGTIGALPEMLQTAYGSLSRGLDLQKNETLLIRGGSSTVGLMAASLAKYLGAKVISTTRHSESLTTLEKYGATYPLLDDKDFEKNMHQIMPDGVDKVLELVGTTSLLQDINFLKEGGKLCFVGALSGKWTLDEFSPFMIPTGTFLTSYAGEANDLPAKVFNDILKEVEQDKLAVPIAKVYHGLAEVGQAQENLESGKYSGKHVVVL
ncbi:zinc-binding dehydrogenase [Companilactobacillus allii]|nr:zinc-binding dehydrogenase [Companilactobacillus allii]USQ68563.1 zinc-binding dehydrogenase [Companilactobacillus allii]